MKKIINVALLTSVFWFSGCATILSGTTEKVKFDAEPSGTKVLVAGQSCVAPCSLPLKKGETYNAKFSKEGYNTQNVVLEKKFNPISLLNMLGLVGWIVDAATGAIWTVSPDAVNADLQKKQ